MKVQPIGVLFLLWWLGACGRGGIESEYTSPLWSLHDIRDKAKELVREFWMFIRGSHKDLLINLQCISHLCLKFASRQILMLLSSIRQTMLG